LEQLTSDFEYAVFIPDRIPAYMVTKKKLLAFLVGGFICYLIFCKILGGNFIKKL
jgi:hypothetical protein